MFIKQISNFHTFNHIFGHIYLYILLKHQLYINQPEHSDWSAAMQTHTQQAVMHFGFQQHSIFPVLIPVYHNIKTTRRI